MNTNFRSEDEKIMMEALQKIAAGTERSAYPGLKDRPPVLTKPEIHFIATKAISDYYTL